jgi:cobalt-zinc-cadmium efflux system membrane fusion protein
MFMDHVKKNERLAILWSKDLGEKKSELVDALARLRIDKQILKVLKDLDIKGATSESSVREGERNVQVGEIATSRAERTLRSWNLSDAEIATIEAEVDRISHGEVKNRDQDANWARVDLVSPIDGTIVEKNVSVGDIVDTNSDIFKIADLSVLSVWLHAFEEDLPAIQKLPKPLQPMLRLPANPELGEIKIRIDRIGEIIDPNEHMALLLGSVLNPRGDLRAGQFVTAAMLIPPEPNTTQIPAKALIDDGDATYVFVQLEPDPPRFKRRRVAVVRRLHDLVDVRGVVTPELAEQGVEPLAPGDVVVSSGALQLEATLAEQQSDEAGEK